MSRASFAKLIQSVHPGAKQVMIAKTTRHVSSVIYAVRKQHVAEGAQKMIAMNTAIVVGVTFARQTTDAPANVLQKEIACTIQLVENVLSVKMMMTETVISLPQVLLQEGHGRNKFNGEILRLRPTLALLFQKFEQKRLESRSGNGLDLKLYLILECSQRFFEY